MTGFGAADGAVLGGRLQVEIRTVNHKHFNVHLKVPGNLQHLEMELRELLRRTPERLTAERDRLRRGVADLLEGRTMEESRLAQEIALIADRLDITEELSRLDTHLQACREALRSGEAVGRQLGFLGQEMLREIN